MDEAEPVRETSRGYIYAILGSLCGGAQPTLIKFLLENSTPIAVTGLSFALSGLILVFYHPKAKPAKGSIKYIIVFGLVGALAAPLAFIIGLNETTAVNASLLANGEILFTTVIAYSVFGERLSRAQATRGLLIVAGIVVVSTDLSLAHVQFAQGLLGNLLILGSTVGWAVENNLIAVATRRFDVSSLSKFRNLLGGLVLTSFAVAASTPFGFTPFEMFALVLLAACVSGATFMFMAAIKRLGAIRMLLVWSTSTIFGAFFALVFLGEQITPAQLAGGACILLGVYLFRRNERPMFVP
jgi:drug/metabolite transporter (DMT)-like permease